MRSIGNGQAHHKRTACHARVLRNHRLRLGDNDCSLGQSAGVSPEAQRGLIGQPAASNVSQTAHSSVKRPFFQRLMLIPQMLDADTVVRASAINRDAR